MTPWKSKIKNQKSKIESPSPGIREWFKAADRYCFGPTSPTSLGLIRIFIGFLSLVNWLLIAVDWDSWFSERGYVPSWLGSLWFGERSPVGFGTGWTMARPNLLHGITDERITIPFYIGVVLCALLTCLGLWTRVSAFLLAIGTITLHHRSGAILHGGDTVLRIETIYLAVSPCGRACSLDRLIGLWKNREPHGPVLISAWPQRLFQYNVALIYLTTIWLKWHGDKWRWPAFNATWYTERLAEFYRFPVPEFMKSLWMARVMTLGTVIVEFSLGTIVFFPAARKWVLLGGLLMHVFIEYSMNIPLFEFLMLTLYLSFFEGHEVAGWAQRVGSRLRRWHVTVFLPGGMRLTPRAVAFWDAVDPFKMVFYMPGEGSSWSATRFDQRPLPAAFAIASRSMGAWIFAWIPRFVNRLLSRSLEPLPEPEPEAVVERRPRKATKR